MDHRHAIAYVFLLLIVLGLAGGWWRASGHWRARRRGSRAFERKRLERRAEQLEQEG
jgi:hypothetical protein